MSLFLDIISEISQGSWVIWWNSDSYYAKNNPGGMFRLTDYMGVDTAVTDSRGYVESRVSCKR